MTLRYILLWFLTYFSLMALVLSLRKPDKEKLAWFTVLSGDNVPLAECLNQGEAKE